MSSPLVCVGIAWTVVFLFTSIFDWKGVGVGIFFLTVAIMAAISIWTGRAFNKFPKISILITIIGSLVVLFDLFKYASRPFFWVVLWFSACCVYTIHFVYLLRKSGEARSAPWEKFLILLVPILFGGYAIHVYPNVRREFSGGATVSIVLHMSKKSSVFNTESAAVSLIDETEQGYYVVHSSDKAIFVKRDLVEEVEFLHSGPPQSPAKP